jgi:hypothetical protein
LTTCTAVSIAVSEFYLRFAELIDGWTADALEEIERWDSTQDVGMTTTARRTFERVLERYDAPRHG